MTAAWAMYWGRGFLTYRSWPARNGPDAESSAGDVQGFGMLFGIALDHLRFNDPRVIGVDAGIGQRIAGAGANLSQSGLRHGRVRRLFGAEAGLGTVNTNRTPTGPSSGAHRSRISSRAASVTVFRRWMRPQRVVGDDGSAADDECFCGCPAELGCRRR